MVSADSIWRYTRNQGYIDVQLKTDLIATIINVEDEIQEVDDTGSDAATLLTEDSTDSNPEVTASSEQSQPVEVQQETEQAIEESQIVSEQTAETAESTPQTVEETTFSEQEISEFDANASQDQSSGENTEEAAVTAEESENIAQSENQTDEDTAESAEVAASETSQDETSSIPQETDTESESQQATEDSEENAAENTESSSVVEETTIAVLDTNQTIAAVINSWASAWSKQDVEAYLGFYHSSFQPADGNSISSWQSKRRSRITNPQWIKVEISELQIEAIDAIANRVSFKQRYTSNTFSDHIVKSMVLIPSDSGWKIQKEETLQTLEN